jgi:hypothetical protein
MFCFQRLRRYAVIYLLLLPVCWLGWEWWWTPRWQEDSDLRYDLDHISKAGQYGVNVRPTFSDMVYMRELDRKLVPRMGRDRPTGEGDGRRLVIVGDVHGCKDERMCSPKFLTS